MYFCLPGTLSCAVFRSEFRVDSVEPSFFVGRPMAPKWLCSKRSSSCYAGCVTMKAHHDIPISLFTARLVTTCTLSLDSLMMYRVTVLIDLFP
jgi:hypothetical protein